MKTTKFQNQLKRKDYFFNLFTFLFFTGSGFAQTFIPLPYSSDTYPYYYAASIFDLLVDKDNNGPSSGLKGVEGFRWWHDNDQSTEYMGMSLTWSAYNKADLWVKGDIYSQGNLTVASTNPNGQHDNFKVLVDDYKTQLISYGDENGLNISSNLGNKIQLGDDNDAITINGKYVIMDYGGANDLAQLAINAGNPVNGAALTVGGMTYIGSSKNIEANPGLTDDLKADCSLIVEKQILTSDLNIIPKPHWKDVVFESDYKKMDLMALENYVKENKHLPGIVSEKEVNEKGYKIHTFNEGLLQNVEELLLHIIDQNKNIRNQNEKIEILNKKIEALEKESNYRK
ncbi:hypothetical protein [Flavobacterium lipolyticum]|uniref:Peptidase S74 domain-containing protein n=1 Tax=Flavobacterium lipolyticum TaxID=2893754 RepID=A0ABS8M5X5_9FLAO|nr:hypothetical protein [Flavobacterium sp. F-126]MCC9020104.1 hypothetical protein [Flavobacterium sp. F-126]